MANKFIATDGSKSLDMLNSNDPAIWNFFSGAPQSSQGVLYAYVAAVYRAYNLFADTIGNLPFALVEIKSQKEYDSSENWENKIGFLPNPNELWRLDTLSYIDSNSVYNLRTSDALGYKTKGLYFAMPSAFSPSVNSNGDIEIKRTIGAGRTETYTADDPRLFYMWRKDHTTEVLPSPNTIAKAIQHSAEQVLYTDSWITHYYKRGGIKPTLIAMKGLVIPDKKDDEEKKWTQWLRGLGRYFGNIARVYNAEAMDVKAFGDGVAELKDNGVYQQALSNIAMGVGMPLSLLLANSANYSTASTEERQWYKTVIIPFSRWLSYGYNEQIFHPMGLHLKFNTSTIDSQQEEDAVNAATAKTLNEMLLACPTYEIFEAISKSYLEVSDELLAAAKKYYGDKQKQPEPPKQQTVQVISSPPELPQPAKWIPSLDELEELRIWREVAVRRNKKGESLVFDYEPHRGGLPEEVTKEIKSKLAQERTWTMDDLKAVFDAGKIAFLEEQPTDILALANAVNKYADALMKG